VTSEPQILFDADRLGTTLIPSRDPLQRRYDVMPDGRRFVVLIGAGFGTSEITLIENWAATAR